MTCVKKPMKISKSLFAEGRKKTKVTNALFHNSRADKTVCISDKDAHSYDGLRK